MTDYLDLPIGENSPEIVTAVVEIPQDCINKYEYDKTLRVFRLDRNLHSPVHYPGDYGFLPRTLAEDGDPLDILILGDAPTFPGCIYHARPIGLFEMLDQGIPDAKILAYATGNPRFSSIQNYTDVPSHILREVVHFFSIYKDLEGKRTQVLGWKDRQTAHEVILASHERYMKQQA
ncbi:inorganic diphosphatase [Acidipila rosea]|uniref:Inorganic pyrophosphatase n=1 Tax=Acidipila rosea TaxID=768535 RepID=A0A4R1LD51_9BACT|nr:inorganic diphosphatase [Acidipila rosea]MBW4027300.1 inorganic diphosphatase [Acidobacteriota bacterium]TCK75627.1 inorganic pyrophosphatase [Acidipila rosea]